MVGEGSALGGAAENDGSAFTIGCSCCAAQPNKSDASDSQSSAPNSKTCQGICAGAVLDRHDIDIDTSQLALLFLSFEFPQAVLISEMPHRWETDALPDLSPLSGRALRTRYLSLTC